ncbi:MAG: (S)-ureidoglycine aminohydrolase [Planctomycetes bacterium]|nr:(S)-ureidoglycine aminohydrolase [Planctomycetota bacterium]
MTLPLGQTRSRVARDHAMIGPDSHVIAALPGWRQTQGVVLISPAMGAGFTQYIAMMGPGSVSAPPQPGVERFVFVRDGAATLALDGKKHALDAQGYAYLPPDAPHEITTDNVASLILFEYRYQAREGVAPPKALVGRAADRKAQPFMGDPDAMLANLLPDEPGYDLAVNLFTFNPGAALPLVEVHVFEHGLYMTRGRGVYRLGDEWFPVEAGDSIWMGPYCPQWFCAIGKAPAQYLYSKNVNRDAMS